jgi:NAD(P)-dependent dehydrogenase (short-subunit alcohol dehydrogenase family)
MAATRILIVGGGSGMGLALAELLVADGARVTLAGRSRARLVAAAERLGVATHPVDITSEEQVVRMAATAGPFDHIVVTAADITGVYGPLADLDLVTAQALVASKVLGPWLVAKHCAVPMGGSMTFTSGIAAYRPAVGGSLVAVVNAALAGLVRALALELAPARVNAISPGWVDTPIWETLAGEAKGERLAAMAARLPVGRIGRPADIAQAFRSVIHNGFITGTVIHVDGGQSLV